MERTLTDLATKLFGDRGLASIVFSDKDPAKLERRLFPRQGMLDVFGRTALEEQLPQAAGLFPLLFVVFSIRLQKSMTAEELRGFFLRLEAVEFRYVVSYAPCMDATIDLFRRVIGGLGQRQTIQATYETGSEFFVEGCEGETVIQLMLSGEPYPDYSVA